MNNYENIHNEKDAEMVTGTHIQFPIITITKQHVSAYLNDKTHTELLEATETEPAERGNPLWGLIIALIISIPAWMVVGALIVWLRK